MKLINKLFLILLVTAVLSCDNNDDPIPDNPFADMTKLVSSKLGVDAYKADIYLKEDPFVGFNNIYVDVYDSLSNERPSDWSLSFAPIMTMMTDLGYIKHTCPLEQPLYSQEIKAYAGAAVFIMPTTEMGEWNFVLEYENTSGFGSLSFPITVVEKENPAMVSFVSEANPDIKYFVALIEPKNPDVGINDFEIGVYMKESMMSFPPMLGHTIEITPEMPSMGHGSPDNVNPTDSGNGHYQGKVNFTMTGLWRVHMAISNANRQVVNPDTWFDIEF